MTSETNLDKIEELIGGLTNALNRGEPINIAAQTFLNAGYSKEAIDTAVRIVSGGSENTQEKRQQENEQSKDPKEISIPKKDLNLKAQKFPPKEQQTNQKPQTTVKEKRRGPSYITIIILLLFSMGIIIAAGIIGLYWNKLFT